MEKVKRQCRVDTVHCESGETVEVFFPVSDFYEADRLFICPGCGSIFAVNPDAEHYLKKPFSKLKVELQCPSCKTSLSQVLGYPENFWSPVGRKIERYAAIPGTLPDGPLKTVEFWNPLS